MVSMGINDDPLLPTSSAKSVSEHEQAKLVPENAELATKPVYDCIVYLIFCTEHQMIATTNLNKCRCTWLPFIVLPEAVTWQRASHEGLALLIGQRNETEREAGAGVRLMPLYAMSYLHMLRVQLPSSGAAIRLSVSAQLYATADYLCCQNSSSVNWLSLPEVLNAWARQPAYRLWGPELSILTQGLFSPQVCLIQEFSTTHALHYLHWDQSAEQKMLQAVMLTDIEVLEIYADYLEKIYPSFYMCYESLASFLITYGHNENKLIRLFSAFCSNRRWFVDFHEFLVGLVAMEPNCSSKLESRSLFIFRYYAADQPDYLNAANLKNLLRDSNPTWSDLQALEEATSLLKGQASLSYEQFTAIFQVDADQKLNLLCRSPSSIVKQIASQRFGRMKTEMAQLTTGTESTECQQPAGRGTCWSCRTQRHEFGSHCVTIDTQGRCAEPTIISPPVQFYGNGTRSRYSLEYIFIGSVPNIFIDLTRNFHHKKEKFTGLLTAKEDWPTFVKYLGVLCKEISGVLLNEEKLLKINAPAIVVGNLQGSLRDLLALEKMFFHSFPVHYENLVFLGNYSGVCGYSIECLVYLFSLKLCAPNKVFLLRGCNELDNRYSIDLYKECTRKYGTVNGKNIHGTLMRVFAKLPIALVVDDAILCTHSAIPADSCPIDGLLKLANELPVLKRDGPMAFDIITRYPRWSGNRKSQVKTAKRKNNKQSSHKSQATVSSKSNSNKSKSGHMTMAKSAEIGQVKSKYSSSSSSRSSSSYNVSNETIQSNSNSLSNDDDSISITANSVEKIEQQTTPKTGDSELMNFKFKAPIFTLAKPNPTFLKTRKVKFKLKNKAIAQPPSSSKGGKHVSVNNKNKKLHRTFDKKEFIKFMAAHDFTFLIRSGSLCANGGFTINFNRKCVTINSCSQTNKTDGQAAVALIDGIDCSVRCIRYSTG